MVDFGGVPLWYCSSTLPQKLGGPFTVFTIRLTWVRRMACWCVIILGVEVVVVVVHVYGCCFMKTNINVLMVGMNIEVCFLWSIIRTYVHLFLWCGPSPPYDSVTQSLNSKTTYLYWCEKFQSLLPSKMANKKPCMIWELHTGHCHNLSSLVF